MFKTTLYDWLQSNLNQSFRLGVSKLSFLKDDTDYTNSRRQYHLQDKQQLLDFQDMHINQFPNQDGNPTPLLHSLQQNLHTFHYLNQDPLPCHLLLPQPCNAHIPLTTHPKPGGRYFCRLQSSSQLLPGSSSSHLCADTCKS